MKISLEVLREIFGGPFGGGIGVSFEFYKYVVFEIINWAFFCKFGRNQYLCGV